MARSLTNSLTMLWQDAPALQRLKRQTLFWQQYLQSPRATGAIAPSGRALGQLMSACLPTIPGVVIELGPGTGAITRVLLDRRPQPQDLIAVESNENFAAALAERYPSVEVLVGQAQQLTRLIDIAPFTASAVVSGLPLRNMPASTHYRILREAFQLLNRGGRFIQFTYGPFCPVAPAVLQRLGLVARKGGTAWRNTPPATVWIIERV